MTRVREIARVLGFVAAAVALVVVGAVTASGCSSADDGTPASASNTATSSVSASSAVSTAPLPGAEVPVDFAAAVDAVRTEGRRITALLVAGDIDALYAATTRAFRAAVSIDDARQLIGDLTAQAPIGERGAERVIPFSPGRALYIAEHAWGVDALDLTVVVLRDGVELGIEPGTPLPPDPFAGRVVHNRLRLPFEGTWFVGESPTIELGNHHQVVSDQRHAYDFVVWRDGATFTGDGVENADYWAWGEPVLAPAAATVVAAVDGVHDNAPQVETNTTDVAGNHVVLDLGHGEYAVIAHFQQGTVRVAVGDRVTQGQELGLTGNSGNSSEPHVHLHVQDSPTFQPDGSIGIPVRFERISADGHVHSLAPAPSGAFVADASVSPTP